MSLLIVHTIRLNKRGNILSALNAVNYGIKAFFANFVIFWKNKNCILSEWISTLWATENGKVNPLPYIHYSRTKKALAVNSRRNTFKFSFWNFGSRTLRDDVPTSVSARQAWKCLFFVMPYSKHFQTNIFRQRVQHFGRVHELIVIFIL